MNGAHQVIDFRSKAKRLDWLRPERPVDAVLEDFDDLYAATQPQRICPPCDQFCDQGRDCPARDNLPAMPSGINAFLGVIAIGLALWALLVTAMISWASP